MSIEELVNWHKKNNRKSMSYTSDDGGCVVLIVGERYAVAGFSIEGANFNIDEQGRE